MDTTYNPSKAEVEAGGTEIEGHLPFLTNLKLVWAVQRVRPCPSPSPSHLQEKNCHNRTNAAWEVQGTFLVEEIF